MSSLTTVTHLRITEYMRLACCLLISSLLIAQMPAVVSNPTGQHGVTLSMSVTTPAPAGSIQPTTFNIYRSATKGGPYALIGSTPVVSGAGTYEDGCGFPPAVGCASPFADGSTYYYVMTGLNPAANTIVNTRTNNPQESTDSAELSVTFPVPTTTSAVGAKSSAVH